MFHKLDPLPIVCVFLLLATRASVKQPLI